MDLEKIFEAAKISSKKVGESVEIYDGKTRMLTLVPLSNVNTKRVYHRSEEYTHTTMWNTPLDADLISKTKLSILMSKLQQIQFTL